MKVVMMSRMKWGPGVLVTVQAAYCSEIFRSDVAHKVLFFPLLQGVEGTRVTFLLTYTAIA